MLRHSAFSKDPGGGNPAGVVLDARGLEGASMLAIAAELGYSETAFLLPDAPQHTRFGVCYFSPLMEVPFCGHATIAAAAAWAERGGPAKLHQQAPSGTLEVDLC